MILSGMVEKSFAMALLVIMRETDMYLYMTVQDLLWMKRCWNVLMTL